MLRFHTTTAVKFTSRSISRLLLLSSSNFTTTTKVKVSSFPSPSPSPSPSSLFSLTKRFAHSYTNQYLSAIMDANNNQKDVDLVTVAESTIQQSLKHLGQIQTKSVDWKYSGKWLRSGIVTYTTPNSTADKSWELVGRTTRQESLGVDGVDIVALLSNYSKTTTTKESDKAIILVVNYRPPVGKPSLEFPAGLIDKGETPTEAALRELKEETGFTGTIRSVSDPLFVDPWKSTENFHLVTIDVDAAHTSNALLTQELDEDENLVPIILPLKGLLTNLNKLRTKYDLAIEGKLYGFAQALSFTESSNWA